MQYGDFVVAQQVDKLGWVLGGQATAEDSTLGHYAVSDYCSSDYLDWFYMISFPFMSLT